MAKSHTLKSNHGYLGLLVRIPSGTDHLERPGRENRPGRGRARIISVLHISSVPFCRFVPSQPAPPPNTSEPHVIPLACYQRQLESPLPYALSLSLSALASDLCAQTTKMSAALISDQTSQTSRASVQPNETLAVPATAFLVWNYNNCLDIILREQKEKCIQKIKKWFKNYI